MSVAPSSNVVPYADFLARRERRRRIAAEFGRLDTSTVMDTDTVAVEAVKPINRGESARMPVGNALSATET
jgi:hypothetical protein